ncbi:MAG TPA: glycosyltransferase family 4 protein [Sphingomicrobium sp.]
MRIAYVTQWFEPEPNIVKGIDFVRELEGAGHSVTVITGLPNYPTGRIYPGYRLRLIQHETVDGVNVVRLPLYPSHDRSSLRRSLNYLSFFLPAFVYLLFRRSRFDLAYVYHPPITVGLAAALARIPFVLDVQDLWPDTIAATGMAGASKLVGPLGAACRFVYRRASTIIAQSEGMRRMLIERGVPGAKVSVVRNWAKVELHDISAVAVPKQPFTLVYGGNLGRAQQLGNLIDAASILERERPEVRILLFGSGVDEPELRHRAHRLGNVRFGGRIPPGEIAREFAQADALLLHLGDDCLFDITIPSKTQYYLAMGRPIVAAVNGETAGLLRKSGAAIVVPPADPPALASAMIEMAERSVGQRERMGRAGADFYRDNLSFSKGMNRTLALLHGTYEAVALGQQSR